MTQNPSISVLIAWELGGGLGHVTKCLLLAQRLLEAGADVAFAVRDLAAVHPLLPDESYRLYQAPVSWLRLRDAGEPADFAELLLHAGFGQTATLKGLVRGWLGLFESSGAQLLIADHAPSAVLAARCAGLPAVLFGHGFFAPPSPWPVFRSWEPAPTARLAQVHRHVLGCVNDCLQEFGTSLLGEPSEALAVRANYLCTYPELDHYPHRHGQGQFLGTLWVDHVGGPVDWPKAYGVAEPRVFAYLRPTLPGLADVLKALSACAGSVLVVSPGIAADVAARWQSPRMMVSSQLLRLRDVADSAALVVCSGSDTMHGMVLEGVPVLALPMSAEQRIAAERVRELGAGQWLLPGASTAQVLSAITALTTDPHYRAQAEAVRARHAGRDIDATLRQVAAECLALAAPA